jgi:uncharacterized protein DUF4245
MAETKRGRSSAGDMVRSLAVVVAVIAVVLLLSKGSSDPVTPTVDYTASLADARAQASYPVRAPAGLPKSWRSTSARVTRNGAAVEWHVGFVTPREDYAGLEQSDGPPTEFVGRFADGSDRSGSVRIGSRTWRRLQGGKPEPRALWLREGTVSTVVAGNASWAELEQLATSLRTG